MSLSNLPLNIAVEQIPVTNVSNLDKRYFSVLAGPSYTNYQKYIASQVSNSTVSILTIPSSESTIIDPKIYAQVQYSFTFTGTSTAGNLIQLGVADAPRAFPLSNSTSTLAATLNGQTISLNQSQVIDPLLRYEKDYHDMTQSYGTTPAFLDQCQAYTDLFGTNRSPFALFGDNVYADPRGGFSGIEILTNTPTSCTLLLNVYEPIFLPLFHGNKSGLVNVSNLNWQWTFRSPLANFVWSHDAVNGNNITSAVCNITAMALYYRQMTPKVLASIPKLAIYPYYSIIPAISSYNAPIAPGATAQLSMQALNLQGIPKMVYIYARQQDSEQLITSPNAYFGIKNVSVTYMNNSGLLASAPEEELYRIAHKNGYTGSYDQWNKYNGAVLCLRMGDDLGLSSLYSPSQLVSNQLSMVVTVKNLSQSTFSVVNLFVQVVYEGTATIGNNTMNLNICVLSNSDVLNSQIDSCPKIEQKPHHNMFGGNSFSDVSSAIGKAVNSVVDAFKEGAEYVAPVAKAALPLLGLGVTGGRRRRKMKGGDVIQRADLESMGDEYME
jgi:hypothetical protein